MKFRIKLSTIPYLAALSAVVLFSCNVILKRPGSLGVDWFDTVAGLPEKGRRLAVDDYMNKRIMEVFKEAWPECVNQRMTSMQCKEFIEDEIIGTFTGRDKYIRVIIKDKRRKFDQWYNTIVITMNDLDMAEGLNEDGLVDYDFDWDGSCEKATPEQEAEIPPILATETDAGSPLSQALTDPNSPDYLAAADPNSPDYEPLILEDEPILVQGTTVEGALGGNDTNPIAGGVVVDPATPNTAEGDDKLNAAIQEAAAPLDSGTDSCVRRLPTFDCSGLSAYNCCLMIKLKVRDHDIHGKAIQCQLIYKSGSMKEKFWLNARGKKVFIFANHKDIVSKIPTIVGEWPEGGDDFAGWLADGGDTNQVTG